MKLEQLKNKRILLWGLGREGQATLLALFPKINATWSIYSDSKLSTDEINFTNQFKDVFVVDRSNLNSCFQSIDIIIKSPGVSLYRPEIALALSLGIQITSSSNIWFSENSNLKCIGVTGSKGKSTTSSLLKHCLVHLGLKVELVGNIGVPLISLLDQKNRPDYYIIELSSYQLADLHARLSAGILLNLYPEHLDWHHSIDNYRKDKFRIADCIIENGIFVTRDELLVNFTNKNLTLFAYDSMNTQNVFHVAGRKIYNDTGEIIVPTTTLSGDHNLKNAVAVLTLLQALNLPIKKALDALPSFKPLAHRLEVVTERNSVLYVDDSISTVPEATAMALSAFSDKPTILILGGQDRGRDWQSAVQYLLPSHVHTIICLGENGDKIYSALKEQVAKNRLTSVSLLLVKNLTEAMSRVEQLVQPGDLVLLSPASPSYDQFKNFEERGKIFKELSLGAPTLVMRADCERSE